MAALQLQSQDSHPPTPLWNRICYPCIDLLGLAQHSVALLRFAWRCLAWRRKAMEHLRLWDLHPPNHYAPYITTIALICIALLRFARRGKAMRRCATIRCAQRRIALRQMQLRDLHPLVPLWSCVATIALICTAELSYGLLRTAPLCGDMLS